MVRNMKTKILLDTDIGSDIDDAVCLTYLLAQEDCELLGITTVTGESFERAKMASAICKVFGADIPVFPGTEEPLSGPQLQAHAQQTAALERWDHDSDFPGGQAISFLSDTIRIYPGEIILLTIGPLTNAALLFSENPDIPSLLKGIVMMCGVYREFPSTPYRVYKPYEWNVHCDPLAASIVFGAPVSIHRSVGLDVTTRLTMDTDKVREKFQTTLLQPVLDFAEIWFRENEVITFHDPLAAATIFDSEICLFKKGMVSVDILEGELAGKTTFIKGDKEAPHEIAVNVDVTRFFEHYFSVIERTERRLKRR